MFLGFEGKGMQHTQNIPGSNPFLIINEILNNTPFDLFLSVSLAESLTEGPVASEPLKRRHGYSPGERLLAKHDRCTAQNR